MTRRLRVASRGSEIIDGAAEVVWFLVRGTGPMKIMLDLLQFCLKK